MGSRALRGDLGVMVATAVGVILGDTAEMAAFTGGGDTGAISLAGWGAVVGAVLVGWAPPKWQPLWAERSLKQLL